MNLLYIDDYKRQRKNSDDNDDSSNVQVEDELETYLYRLGDPNDPNRVNLNSNLTFLRAKNSKRISNISSQMVILLKLVLKRRQVLFLINYWKRKPR